MTSSSWGKGLGLVMLGFLTGIVVSNLDAQPGSLDDPVIDAVAPPVPRYQRQNLAGDPVEYTVNYSTPHWDVLTTAQGHAKEIALGQNGQVRVVVIDDARTFYVMTHKQGAPLWEARLVDVGNDGSVEIAGITGLSCEKFSP